MRSIMSLVTITLISSILLILFPHTPAAYGPLNYACCVKYTQNPLPFRVITGFAEQKSTEVCRIDAIIFLTKNSKKVCASIKDQWVRAALVHLRSKIVKLTEQGNEHLTTAGLTTKSP